MTLEEAIKTALVYEGKVYKTYLTAMEAATDDDGRRVFKTLGDEEKGHIDYLRARLEEWQSTGKISDEELVTVVPSRDSISEGVDAIRNKLDKPSGRKHDAELQMLQRALEVERETSNFYREMVQTMDEVGRGLFQRFLEIEEGHQAIVQAEIDCVSGTGYWFDIPEFKLG